MRNVAAEGRTVLFVSHNMGAIRSLCQRAICLDKGEVTLDDQADRLVSYYLGQNTVEGAMVSSEDIEARMEPTKKQKEPYIRIKKIAILDQTRALREWFYSDEEIVISIFFKCFKPVRDLRVVASVVDENDVVLLASQNVDDPRAVERDYRFAPGVYEASCVLPKNSLGERRFLLSVGLLYPKIEHIYVRKILSFEVKFKGYNNIQFANSASAFLRPQLPWSVQPVTKESTNGHVYE